MAELDLSKATTTDLTNSVPDFIVTAQALDAQSPGGEETFWYFSKATQNFGYYGEIPEIYSAANGLATWAFGRGWSTDKNTVAKAELEHIKGIGFDTFDGVIWNLQVVKKVVGDSFAQIVKPKDILLNLIPISPERVRLVFGKKKGLKRYDVYNGVKWEPLAIEKMLHLSNNRIGDQIHGTSQIDATKWIIDARNEALISNRMIERRGRALGIIKYKTNNEGKILFANQQIEKSIKNGEMLGVPDDTLDIEDFPNKSTNDRMTWITYLENFFYQTFGVPRSIATSDGTSEVGGKMGHVIFEPTYVREQREMENLFLNKLGIIIKWNKPPSLAGLQQETEEKNTGQLGIQPNDVEASLTRE